jgi:hypothetical protein
MKEWQKQSITALFLIIVALGGCKTQKEEKAQSVTEEKKKKSLL